RAARRLRESPRRPRRGDGGALPARRAEPAPVRRGRAPVPRGVASRARGAVPAVLRGADRRRSRGCGRGRATGVRPPMTTADALKRRLAATPTVGVIGLGYVGLPLAVAFADSGATVIGLDVDPTRVARVRAGESFIEDVSTETLGRLVAAERLTATDDIAAFKDADAIVICVPTPLGKSKEPDISYIVSAADAVAGVLRRGQLIVLESTTYPGTTQEILQPRFEARGLKAGEDFFLAFSPERIDPGNQRYTLKDIPKVVGGLTPACRELATTFYPGPGLGGHCLPSDPHYLSWRLRLEGYEPRFITFADEINRRMPAYVVQLVADALNDRGRAVRGARILVLGVAYKANVADTRDSPAIEIIQSLGAKGAVVAYHDPFVPSLTLDRATLDSVAWRDADLAGRDVVLILTPHAGYDWGAI